MGPIKEPRPLAQPLREIRAFFVGILPPPPLLLLVSKKPVVITQRLLQTQIVKPSYPELLEPLYLDVLLLELDVLTILEAVQASLELSNNVVNLQLQMVLVKLQPQEVFQPQEHVPQEFVQKP